MCRLAGPQVETGLFSPLRIEIDAIRRIGHHEGRLVRQKSREIMAGGSVAAQ